MPEKRRRSSLFKEDKEKLEVGAVESYRFFPDGCEVDYSDVVAESSKVKLASLGLYLVAG
jgi:hypothetical protein